MRTLSVLAVLLFSFSAFSAMAETQHINCGDDDSGFDLQLLIEDKKIVLEESLVSLKGDLSPDWYDIDGQVEAVKEKDGYLVLRVGSWSAAHDDPYDYDVVMRKDLLLKPFKRNVGIKLEADGSEANCYSYIK